MSNSKNSALFFIKDSGYTLRHEHGPSHLVIFSTTNNLALGVLAYFHYQLAEDRTKSMILDTKHFPARTVQEVQEAALDWVRSNIDPNVSIVEQNSAAL